MGLTTRLRQWGGARLSRRLTRTIPFVGTLVAIATVGSAMRRKGLVRGVADTALNALPFVGAAKLTLETVRRRDMFRDKHRYRVTRPAP